MDAIEIEIKNILPTVGEETTNMIMFLLGDLGVTDKTDLQFIEEKDLLPIITTIQARKLIRAWKNEVILSPETAPAAVPRTSGTSSENFFENVQPSGSSDSEEVRSVTGLSSNNLDWAYQYRVPWDQMPEDLMNSLQENKRPSPSLRRHMVRIIADSIQEISQKPGKRALEIIARKIVKRYSPSLSDMLCGEIVGEGHNSLLRQIMIRFDNLNKRTPFKVIKRSLQSQGSDSEKNKLYVSESYGCINWQPSSLPVNETKDSQEAKRATMLKLSATDPKTWDINFVKQLLTKTYFTQRLLINKKKDIVTLKAEWPLLFTKDGLVHHFEQLVGINIMQKMGDSLSHKRVRLFSFLKTLPSTKAKNQMKKLLDKLDASSVENPTFSVLICLLMEYFEENTEELLIPAQFIGADAIDVIGTIEVENAELPNTPCLICHGKDITTATSYMLVIKGNVVINDISSFFEAFTLMFAAYFCFNIHYPKAASTTLEFIQRCFLGINPNRGSKVDPKIRKREAINPKILAILNRLSNFEWQLSL